MTSLSDEDGSDDDDDDKPRVAAGSSGVRAIPQTSKGKQAIRAQAERKAKGVEQARSQSVDEATPDSRASSFSGPSAQYLPQPPELHQQQQHDGGSAGPQMPQDPSQQNGFAPPGALPFPFGGLPNLGAGPNGLPNLAGQLFPFSPGAGMPSFPGFPAGLPPNFAFSMPTPYGFPPQQQQQLNGTSASPASNGVPSWFGALNSGAGQGQPPMPQPPHLQLMQQLGMPGWPGASMTDPAAAMQAFQQQQQQLQQQQQQQHDASQRHQQQVPPPFSSPYGRPLHTQHHQHHAQEPDASPSSHPRPAPMYGTPSLPTYPPATPGSSGTGGGPDAPTSRPGSVASMHSHAPSHHSPAPQGAGPSHASPHLDAWQNKPRLQVAIPAESGAKEGTKPGLVTAGGASILGAGFGYGGRSGAGGETAHERDNERRERGGGGGGDEQDDASVPKSAFAADLLPSPFYPNQDPAASTSSSYGFMGGYGAPASTSSQHFQWPTAPPPSQGGEGPAPPLGAGEAPDLVRRGSFSDLTSAAAAAQAGEGEGEEGGEEEAREGEGRGKKRENEEGADEEGAAASTRSRKRRG